MVTLLVDSQHLEVVLSRAEKLSAFHRGDIVIDRGDILRVQLTDNPRSWIRGIRAPGLGLPGLKIGTWRSVSGKDFVAVRGRRPGVVIDLVDGGAFSRIILTTRHGERLLKALRLEGDDVSERLAAS